MRAKRLVLIAAAAGMFAGPGAALAQTGSHGSEGSGGNLPPGMPTTGSQGTQNAIPPSYGVSRSTPTGAAPSSNRYVGQGPQVKTFKGQTTAGGSTTPGQSNTATQ
jgi:hypothetical protein